MGFPYIPDPNEYLEESYYAVLKENAELKQQFKALYDAVKRRRRGWSLDVIKNLGLGI